MPSFPTKERALSQRQRRRHHGLPDGGRCLSPARSWNNIPSCATLEQAGRTDTLAGFTAGGWGKPGLPIVWELTSGDPCQADALEKEMATLVWRMPSRLQSKTGTWLNMHACSNAGTPAHRGPCTHLGTHRCTWTSTRVRMRTQHTHTSARSPRTHAHIRTHTRGHQVYRCAETADRGNQLRRRFLISRLVRYS